MSLDYSEGHQPPWLLFLEKVLISKARALIALKLSSQKMYVMIGSRKSTSPQHRQLNITISKSE